MTTKHLSLPPRASRLAGALGLSLALGLIGLLAGGGHRKLRQAGNPVASPGASRGAARSTSADAAKARLAEVYGKLPLSFEPNEGQTAGRVRFLARGSGYGLFLTGDEAVLTLQKSEVRSQKSEGETESPRTPNTESRTPAVLRMKLVGANRNAPVTGLDELPGKSNYFIGNKRGNWRTNVPNYAKVRFDDVYPGVDLVYYGHQGQLEYDFVVAPGADPRAIALQLETADSKFETRNSKLEIAPSGDLLIHARGGDVVFHRPVSYQPTTDDRRPTTAVEGHYKLTSRNQVSFEVGPYDRNRPLVIDPTLSYSTYLGGSADDFGNAVAVLSGEAYVTGQTASFSSVPPATPFPTVTPEQSVCGGCSIGFTDAFVTKLNATGTAIVYSTYLGGSSSDVGAGIAVDSVGNAYVVGTTFSVDFPMMNAFQPALGGVEDAFVTKLDAAGSTLVYSTYLGGNLADEGFGIALDNTANCKPAGTCAAYVVGSTESTNFPTLDPLAVVGSALSGNFDVFVTKLSGAGNTLVYSTYFGGTAEDDGYAIAVDPSSNAYITGRTFSNNFPLQSAFRSAFGGVSDAFVTKLSFASSKLTLAYSTYLGGANMDEGFGIALDSSQNVYVTGETHSTDFPTTPGAFQTAFAGGTSDAFVSKLKSDGSALVYSTYLGGSGQDQGDAIAVDATGKANVAGFTFSGTPGTPTAAGSFPTANAIQTAGYNGNEDAFVARIVPSGCGLGFSTYLGGKSKDQANGVTLDFAGNAYVTGFTSSNDFPVSASPVQNMTGGGNDAFVAKIGAATAPAVCLSPTSVTFNAQTATTTSSGQMVTLTNAGDAALSITSITANGPYAETNTCGSSVAAGANCSISVTFTPPVSGTQAGTLTIMDNAGGPPCTANPSLTCHVLALSGIGTDFGLSANPATASVSQGQSATYTITLTPSLDFTTPVSLTCSVSPALAPGSCSISPSTVTPSGTTPQTATVTAMTVKGSMMAPWGQGPGMKPPPLRRRIGLPWLLALLGLALATILAETLGRGRNLGAAWLRLALPFATLLLFVLVWTGCGVSSSLPASTPPGSYNVTVTGTAGTLVHSIRVGLTVQ